MPPIRTIPAFIGKPRTTKFSAWYLDVFPDAPFASIGVGLGGIALDRLNVYPSQKRQIIDITDKQRSPAHRDDPPPQNYLDEDQKTRIRYAAKHFPTSTFVLGDNIGYSSESMPSYISLYNEFADCVTQCSGGLARLSAGDITVGIKHDDEIDDPKVEVCRLLSLLGVWGNVFLPNVTRKPDEWRFMCFYEPDAGFQVWMDIVPELAKLSASFGKPMILASFGSPNIEFCPDPIAGVPDKDQSPAVRKLLHHHVEAMELIKQTKNIIQAVWWSYRQGNTDRQHRLTNDAGGLTRVGKIFVDNMFQ